MTTVGRDVRRPARPRAPTIRPAREDELTTCATIWREALNDYLVRLGQPEMPADLTAISRLYRHTRATDPDRFVVALDGDGPAKGTQTLVGFASAVRREGVWFLSMLFVRPGHQGRGIGRALLHHVLPDDAPVLSTATDSAQPISNALYASLGIPPRTTLYYLIGRPAGDGFPTLPEDVAVATFEEVAAEPGGDEALVAAVDGLDREVLGYAHPVDHRWLRLEGRRGFLFRGADGGALGYGYASEAGRTGPVATRDPALLPALLGHLLGAVTPNGASAVWIPGPAGETMTAAVRAGMRIEHFPVLLCWSRPFADFARYLPISPGLL